jgi:hypothetical protein
VTTANIAPAADAGAALDAAFGTAVASRIDPSEAPISVVEIDLDDAEGGSVRPLPRSGAVLGLVRVHRRPVGVLCARLDAGDAAGAGSSAAEVSAAAETELVTRARREFGAQVAQHLAQDAAADDTGGAADGDEAACDRLRARMLADPPPLTVVVATRERPASLARCLDSLLALDYPGVEIVVVDNAPLTRETAELVTRRYAGRVAYATEPRRGLANAHNRGLAAASGEVIAFTDDDVIVDREWASALVEGFRLRPRAGCVTGLIMPAELETRPQAMLERRGAFAKGFRLTEHHADVPGTHPLFPFTAGRLGSGANMAFRADVLRAAGGFDPALGTGTAARGGDDLLAFFRTAVGGRHSVVYQPSALVWHHHRKEPGALAQQAFGYGVGLGAYLAAAVAREPRTVFSLLRRLPSGTAYALRDSRPDAADPAAWPVRLARLERYGLLCGPAAYARSRWRERFARGGSGGGRG